MKLSEELKPFKCEQWIIERVEQLEQQLNEYKEYEKDVERIRSAQLTRLHELGNMVDKMKCCENCRYNEHSMYAFVKENECYLCDGLSKWEMNE